MRRWLVFLLVMFLVACGGDDGDGDDGAADASTDVPTATDDPFAGVRKTLPPNVTIDPNATAPPSTQLLDNGGEDDSPRGSGPTLPPPATIDPNATAAPPTQSSGDGDADVNPRGSGPTLPPSETPTATLAPTLTPTVAPSPTYTPPATEPAICDGFEVDFFLNQENRTRRQGDEVTIYWIAPNRTEGNLTYVVNLYNQAGQSVLAEPAITTDIFYVFPARYFFRGNTYSWQVKVLQNGVDIGCTPLDDEIIVN